MEVLVSRVYSVGHSTLVERGNDGCSLPSEVTSAFAVSVCSVLKTWRGWMFTCTSYSCLPRWMMEFKRSVRWFLGAHYSCSPKCLPALNYYFLKIFKCSVLILEKTRGVYFLTWCAMNSASPMTRPSSCRSRRQC